MFLCFYVFYVFDGFLRFWRFWSFFYFADGPCASLALMTKTRKNQIFLRAADSCWRRLGRIRYSWGCRRLLTKTRKNQIFLRLPTTIAVAWGYCNISAGCFTLLFYFFYFSQCFWMFLDVACISFGFYTLLPFLDLLWFMLAYKFALHSLLFLENIGMY